MSYQYNPLLSKNLDYYEAAGSATWGSITGTLSNQTDLQAALDAKVEIEEVDTLPDPPVAGKIVRLTTDNCLYYGKIV